nr:unnamed protein product [Callosobruchus chinensis]
MILTSRKKQPFTVKQFRYTDIIDFKNWWPDYIRKQHKESPSLPNNGAYKEPVPINEKNIVDIKKVMPHIQGETLEFYYHVTSWVTARTEQQILNKSTKFHLFDESTKLISLIRKYFETVENKKTDAVSVLKKMRFGKEFEPNSMLYPPCQGPLTH